MPAKDLTGLYDCFTDKSSYSKAEIQERVKKWIEKNQFIKSGMNRPTSIELGDIISYSIAGVHHPCIVFKKKDGVCYALVATTKDHEHHFLAEIKHSRIFPNTFFSITVVSCPEAFALDNFIGLFDSIKELKAAIKLLKTKYKDIL